MTEQPQHNARRHSADAAADDDDFVFHKHVEVEDYFPGSPRYSRANASA